MDVDFALNKCFWKQEQILIGGLDYGLTLLKKSNVICAARIKIVASFVIFHLKC